MDKDRILVTLTDTTTNKFNASSKAVRDVITTCNSLEFKNLIVNIGNNLNNQIPYALRNIINWSHWTIKIICGAIKIGRNNKFILIQYSRYAKSYRLLFSLLRIRNIRFSLLIHDLEFLRKYGIIPQKEIALLNSAAQILVHTKAMRDLLIQNGISSEIIELEIFDYYTNEISNIQSKNNASTKEMNTIVFAGNLEKSIFLHQLFETFRTNSLKFNLYGVNTTMSLPDFANYKGKFSPEDVSKIEGYWGLVWDGESIDTCSGFLGNYLKYISPHKTSLYIVAGLPIIIWSHSAMAPFVIKNNIGIVIDSLNQIESKLSSIDFKTYNEMKQNVQRLSTKLKNGSYLKAAIQQADK